MTETDRIMSLLSEVERIEIDGEAYECRNVEISFDVDHITYSSGIDMHDSLTARDKVTLVIEGDVIKAGSDD